ncbi:MAG: methionine adenosyltransferase [Bacteroidota bacterium]
MPIQVSALDAPAPAALPVEIVERKGVGHPDTICDALAEALSVALSRFYLERFGAILHHNVDKALLWGGAARPRFGGGEVLEPIELYLAGRATAAVGDVRVPIDELVQETARDWLRRHIRHVDPVQHFRIHSLIRPTSADLAGLFERRHGAPLANDTSFGVGYAPLDRLEQVVLAVEHSLNAPETKARHPALGEDVKVMGVRTGERIALTVACALVSRHVADLDDYRQAKAAIASLAVAAAQAAGAGEVEVAVNAADGDTESSVYLTVTGLSAEAGDDGQVGRGNRLNGLITPFRPMSLEAVAGKNPVTHVGKLYNLAAHRIGRALVAEVPGVVEAYCWLLGRIGTPIDAPQVADVKLRLADAAALEAVRPRALEVVQDNLRGIGTLWREIAGGGTTLW